MSGSPKYTRAQLGREQRRQIEERRRKQEAEEQRRRAEAAQREQEQRIVALRTALQGDLGQLQCEFSAASASMYETDRARLRKDLANVEKVARSATVADVLVCQALALDWIRLAMVDAVSLKRRDDEERQRLEQSRGLQAYLDHVERQLQAIGEADSRRFDAAGRDRLALAIRRASQSLQARNLAEAAESVRDAGNLLAAHREQVLAAREQWKRVRSAAEEAVARVEDLVAGLREDAVVMRWQPEAVCALEHDLAGMRDLMAQGAFHCVEDEEERVRVREQEMVGQASVLQLQADQRDAIAATMAEALHDLGFEVTPPTMEHVAHPASAVVFHARSATGQAIGVSVPVEGEVWYEVQGYAMEARARVGGGTSATCDQAEVVLEEMHELLREKYGVATDGLNWEGKDPDRRLRQADELPRGTSEVRRGGC